MPKTLSWGSFVPSAAPIRDPHTGEEHSALTRFTYALPNSAPAKSGGQFVIAAHFPITIRPQAKVWTKAAKTDSLLAHEQLHYDLGTALGRRLALDLQELKADTKNELMALIKKAVELHFHTRAKAIHTAYDNDTEHGSNSYAQTLWKNAFTQTLANANADTLNGYDL